MKKYSFSVIANETVENKIYQLIRINVVKCSPGTRTKYLNRIMEEESAFGLIEIYENKGIVRKPSNNILAILIKEKC